MVDTTLQDKISRLGYSQLWVDCGVLTNGVIDSQIKELDLGEDDNIEHYRYRTLTNYFSIQTAFDDGTLRRILHLLQSDSDQAMAGSAMVDLLKKQVLTDKQFDTVADILQTFGDWTKKQIDRERRNRMKS